MNSTLTKPNPAQARDYFTAKMQFTTGPVELKRAMDQQSVVVVDVRAADDYARGHVPGAISLPQDKWDQPEGLAKDKTNVLYCYSQVCHLAANAAVGLTGRGYSVMELVGGFEGWKDYQMPIETAEGRRNSEAPAFAGRFPKQENL
jgi:rhodanese-related sulfurtransferase